MGNNIVPPTIYTLSLHPSRGPLPMSWCSNTHLSLEFYWSMSHKAWYSTTDHDLPKRNAELSNRFPGRLFRPLPRQLARLTPSSSNSLKSWHRAGHFGMPLGGNILRASNIPLLKCCINLLFFSAVKNQNLPMAGVCFHGTPQILVTTTGRRVLRRASDDAVPPGYKQYTWLGMILGFLWSKNWSNPEVHRHTIFLHHTLEAKGSS